MSIRAGLQDECNRLRTVNTSVINMSVVPRLVKTAVILCDGLGDYLVEQNYGAAKASKEELADTLDELYAAVPG